MEAKTGARLRQYARQIFDDFLTAHYEGSTWYIYTSAAASPPTGDKFRDATRPLLAPHERIQFVVASFEGNAIPQPIALCEETTRMLVDAKRTAAEGIRIEPRPP